MHIRLGWFLLLLLGGAVATLKHSEKGDRDQGGGKPKPPPSGAAKDLSTIEGIGPKIQEILETAGIRSFKDLASASVEELREVLGKAGGRYRLHDPTTWPQQASLAAAGKWDDLDRLREGLKGGRKV